MKSIGLLLMGALAGGLLGCGQSDTQRAYYADGKLREEVALRDGKPAGKFTTYYPSGKVKNVSFIKDGRMDSLSVTYYEDGRLKARQFYRAGQLDGLAENYFDTGALSSRSNYRGGVRSGYTQEYYRDHPGVLRKKTYYFNLKDKETIELAATYRSDGTPDARNEGKVTLQAEADTIALGQTLPVSVGLADPDVTLHSVVTGPFDDHFALPATDRLDTTKATDRRVTIDYKPARPGWQPLRGFALELLTTQFEGKSVRTQVRPVYFEYGVFVKP